MTNEKKDLEGEVSSRISYLWNIHSYVNGYIRFADTKAAFVVTWSLGLIAVLYSKELHRLDGEWYVTFFSVPAWLGLGAGFFLSVSAIMPRVWSYFTPNRFSSEIGIRTNPQDRAGMIFWDEILCYGDEEKFGVAVNQKTTLELHTELTNHLFMLSRIASRKYKLVTPAIAATSLGTIFSALVLFLR